MEKLATIQMLDVSFATTDGRRLVMPRYTAPNAEQVLLLHQLHPLVDPQVSHFKQVPLRTIVKLWHSEQETPS